MSCFLSSLSTTKIGAKLWALNEPLVYRYGYNLITVPKDFKTDLTTYYYEGRHTEASVLHDYLLSTSTRDKALIVMRSSLESLGVPRFQKFIILSGVKFGNILHSLKAK